MGNNETAVLASIVERVENLLMEKQGILDDIKDVKAEYKAQGGSVNMVDYAIKMRKLDREARAELLAEQQRALEALGLA